MRRIHHLRAGLFFVVLASGFLLFSPTLRAEVTGGYSLSVEQMHLFFGLVFTVLCLVPFGSGKSRSKAKPENARKHSPRLRPARRVAAGCIAVPLLASGLALWFNLSLPTALVDTADSLHQWFTYAACLVVGLHIYEASRASAQRRRAAAANVGSRDSEVGGLAKAASGS